MGGLLVWLNEATPRPRIVLLIGRAVESRPLPTPEPHFLNKVQPARKGWRPIFEEAQTGIDHLSGEAGPGLAPVELLGLSRKARQALKHPCRVEEAAEVGPAPGDDGAGLRLGAYQILLHAIDAEAAAGAPPAFTAIELPPPFLRRWGVIIILGLLAAYAIISFERYRSARLKELNAALSVSQDLTQQLAMQQIELGRATRVLALDYAVTCALVESPTLVEAARKILQTICVTTGWDVGVISDLDPQSAAPRRLGVWRQPARAAGDSTPDHDPAGLPETGLAAQVLASRRPYWVSDMADSASRWRAGVTASLRGGFGFPILVESEVLGVLELYSYDVRQADPELIHNASSIGSHIGQLIKRKRAEDELSRSKEERLLELERVRRRIATDLHDEVGSSLTKIALLSEAVRQKVDGKNQDAADRLGTVISLSNELVEAMSDIVWAINPQKDYLSDLLQRMRRFASDIFTACQIAFCFHTPGLEQNIRLSASVRREVFLIFKESIHNVVKHSGCSKVTLDLAVDRRGLTLSISDNGRGFNPALAKADTGYLTSQHKGGNGLASMRRRAREMDGQFDVQTGIGRGTTIILRLPISHAFKGMA